MHVTIKVDHATKRVAITAEIEFGSAFEDHAVQDIQFGQDTEEMTEYFRRHPSRLEFLRTDLLLAAMRMRGVFEHVQ